MCCARPNLKQEKPTFVKKWNWQIKWQINNKWLKNILIEEWNPRSCVKAHIHKRGVYSTNFNWISFYRRYHFYCWFITSPFIYTFFCAFVIVLRRFFVCICVSSRLSVRSFIRFVIINYRWLWPSNIYIYMYIVYIWTWQPTYKRLDAI